LLLLLLIYPLLSYLLFYPLLLFKD